MDNQRRTGGFEQGLDSLKTIDQIVQHLPFDCRFNTSSGFCFSATDSKGQTAYCHCRCRQLTCRSCAKARFRELAKALEGACIDHSLIYYCVLTLPACVPADKRDAVLKKALGRMLQEARRTFKAKGLAYAWALGIGKGDNLHLNVLVNLDLRRSTRYGRQVQWLKTVWHRLTGAYQVRVQEIRDGTHGNVVRYSLTDMFRTVLACPGIKRRIGCSRGIRLGPEAFDGDDDGLRWVRLGNPSAFYARAFGVDACPVTNGTFIVNDASASYGDAPAVSALERRPAAGGPTLPAAGPAGCGPRLQGKGAAHE